ncbi:hypothetical protein ACFO9Q_12100 [Paenibacillus sp. GCM10023252]|uniref:hypothetical protein n=1 Tax=Paenibacillus sp. GCM10023252 TaxID=3252649 RepID=UPI003614C164
MSRVEKFGGARGREVRQSTIPKEASEPAAQMEQDNGEETLPPRRVKHSTQLNRLTKWYYNFLFIAFVSLVAALFWYGKKLAS